MLRKLYKYDFLCSSRKNVPFYVFYFVLTIACKIIDESFLDIYEEGILGLLIQILIGIIEVAYGVMTFIVFFGGFFIAISRFKKNLFTDEGYLMNTLPVKPCHHIWSKLLNALTWSVISIVVLLLGNLIMEGFNYVKYDVEQLFNMVEDIIKVYGAEGTIAIILFVLNFVAALVCLAMLIMFVTGFENAFLVSKKKYVTVIVGVAIVVFFNLGSVVLGNVLSDIISGSRMNDAEILCLIFGTTFAVSAVLFVLSFLGTKYLMEKKLNLQ